MRYPGVVVGVIRAALDILRDRPSTADDVEEVLRGEFPLAWEDGPAEAMTLLLRAACALPLQGASSVVEVAVTAWTNREEYSWRLGGDASRDMLAALALTANGRLADADLVAEHSAHVLERWTSAGRPEDLDVSDFVEKRQFLLQFLRDGERVSLEPVYSASRFDSTCLLLVADFERVSREVMEHFANRPERLQELTWRQFEQLLSAVFANHGYQTELGPGRSDGGVDLRLIYKDAVGHVLTLVQAKRYSPKNPVGLQAVQALSGAVDDQGAHRGLFVTTSRYLPGAMKFAERQNGRLVLATSAEVAKWCGEAAAQQAHRAGAVS